MTATPSETLKSKWRHSRVNLRDPETASYLYPSSVANALRRPIGIDEAKQARGVVNH